MALTICHTADWHLGHTLYRRPREREHAAFLAWLLDQLAARGADALLVAGDVFESGSPPGSALAMFYAFLAEARRRLPALCIVVVAGNHDSPARLAAPDPVLRAQGVSVIGSVPYDVDRERGDRLAIERLVIPVTRGGEVVGRVVAVPFLRSADLPAPIEGSWGADPHARGARHVYDLAIAHARAVRGVDEPIVVTGHFAAAGARMSRDSERLVVGGIDGTLPVDVIDARDVAYIALGHLHLAQRVTSGSMPEHVEARYAGSPIPLAFSERGFAHEVRFVTMERDRVVRSEGAVVPRTVELVRVPERSIGTRAEVVEALARFPAREREGDSSVWPWVEVRAQARADDRDALDAIERAADGRALHLAHVSVERPELESAAAVEARAVTSLDVRDVLVGRWTAEHGEPPSEEVLAALDEATAEARVRLEQRRQRNVELDGDRTLVRSLTVAARRGGERAELED